MLRLVPRLLIVLLAALLGACATSENAATTEPANPWVPDYRDSTKELVVLGFFNMSCRTCQSMGPHMAELYGLVQQRGLGPKIDFYVYGSKATPLECYQYEQRYQAPYPVISDYDRSISKRFGRVSPPRLIVLERRDGALVEKTRLRYLRGDKAKLLEKILR